MFCLTADIEIREATGNRLGLQDAMRGVLAAGGSHEADWSIERILATADKAVGVNVLTHLHNEWGRKPMAPHLDQLWHDLGLRNKDGSVEFDAGAPLAAIGRRLPRGVRGDVPPQAHLIYRRGQRRRRRHRLVRSGITRRHSPFSIHLTQISTLGPSQNLVPIARLKKIPAIGDIQEHHRPYFRFYFEGLVAHIHLDGEYESHKLGPLVLGLQEFITVTTVTYEMSFQRENLMRLMADAHTNWPDLMAKL